MKVRFGDEPNYGKKSHTADLEKSKEMDGSLGYTTKIMIDRVFGLLSHEEDDAFPKLVTWQSGNGQKDEDPIEDSNGDFLEWGGHHEDAETNENVRED